MIKAIDRDLTDGARIVLAFVVLWYVVPAIACAAIEVPTTFDWPRGRGEVWMHFAIAVACLSGGALAAGWRRRPAPRASSRRPFPLGVLALALLAIAVGAMSLAAGGASWRYGGASMSERLSGDGGALVAATAVLQAIAPCLAWWIVLMRPDTWLGGGTGPRTVRWAVALAAIAGINGLNTAIRALFAAACMLWPAPAHRLLFSGGQRLGRRGGVAAALAGIAILGGAFAFTGMLAKTGKTLDADWESHTDPAYLLRRHAVHFQHAMGALEIGIDEVDDDGFAERRSLAWREAAFRLGVLTGDPSWGERPEPASLSRWTLERFANFDLRNDTRSGSSPSVIGTAALCLPPPWSFVALAAFSFLLVRVLDWFLRDCDRLSVLGCLLFAYMPIRFVTDTPLGLVNPFGIPAIVVGLAAVARIGHGMYIRARPWEPATSQGTATARP